MELQAHFNKLLARLRLAEDHFIHFQSSMPFRLDHSHWMFLEGLSSTTWQYWGTFCRSVVIDSALGAKTASGVSLTPCAACWEEVSYIASRVVNARAPVPGGTNSKLRIEPTWGDPIKLNIVINALELSNKNTLARSVLIPTSRISRLCAMPLPTGTTKILQMFWLFARITKYRGSAIRLKLCFGWKSKARALHSCSGWKTCECSENWRFNSRVTYLSNSYHRTVAARM
jgi:hypothetical protein